MEKSNIKITKKAQFEKLVQLMENNPDVVRGKPQFGTTQIQVRELWEGFAVDLNSLGPPTRTSREWQRVWIHYKASVKKKLAHNKESIRTAGGGSSQEVALNSLEECVSQLIHIKEQVVPSGLFYGTENTPPIPRDTPTHTAASAEARTEAGAESTVAPGVAVAPPIGTFRRKNIRKTPEMERLELLKKQTDTQAEVLKTLKKIEKTSYQNYEINKQLLEIKRRKLALLEMQLNVGSELDSI